MESNVQKMREALENIKREAETTCEYRDYPVAGAPGERGACPVVDADWIIDECRAALSAPLRNCDVGTADEQYERHEAYCKKQDMNCLNDDILNCRTCFAKWAQMPYENEGNDV